MGDLFPELLDGRLPDRGDEVPVAATPVDLIHRVDHAGAEVLQRDEQVLGLDLAGVEDERLRVLVLRVEGEDLDLVGEVELQALCVVRAGVHAVLADHVEDQDGADVLREDREADELVQDRLARPRASEDPERLFREGLEVHVDEVRLDAADRAEGDTRVRDLVDRLDVRARGVTGLGEVRRDRLRLGESAALLRDELDGPEEGLAVEERPAVALVRAGAGEDRVLVVRPRQPLRDLELLVHDVLDEAVEVVFPTLDDDREPNPKILGIVELELGLQSSGDGTRDNLANLHLTSLANWSRYSWNAPLRRPSICVSPAATSPTGIPRRPHSLRISSSYTSRDWRTRTAKRCASMRP